MWIYFLYCSMKLSQSLRLGVGLWLKSYSSISAPNLEKKMEKLDVGL